MSKGKILVADDEPAITERIKFLLEKRGFDVESFENGRLLWERYNALRANQESVAAVVTDYNMPEMDGAELTKKIRGIEREMPVFMLSARISDIPAGIGALKPEVVLTLKHPTLRADESAFIDKIETAATTRMSSPPSFT